MQKGQSLVFLSFSLFSSTYLQWFAFNIVSWGIVVAASAAANNFAGLVILRTLLGVFECSIQPTFIILTSMWYKKEEQAVPVSLWYCMNGLQTAVGG